ncbi:MAG: hypothetical protein EBS19_15590, partial [Spirochaetia bacterium]|nr:hypothetical protein [Spirochaetia bacterium]
KKYFKQMVDAVKKCHDKSICHHDIKLENFMTARNLGYSIKLLDFGLSHKFNETITATPIDVAKTLSRPPEILENFNCNGKYDIFMLGRCLFEIEGGRAPFENTHDDKWWTAFKDKDKKNFWKLNEQKGFTPSQEFKELFEGMMNPDPEKRFDIDKVILSKYYQRCKEDFEKMSSTVGVAVAVGAPVASPFKKYKKRKSNKHLRVQRISRKKASVSRKKSKRGSARARRSLKRGSAHSRQSRRL